MKTVLVVEDTEALRELMLVVLRDAGYRAIGAEDGHEQRLARSEAIASEL